VGKGGAERPRRGCEVGKGGAERPRRGCEVAGRVRSGGVDTARVQDHCARARVGGARTFRLNLGLLARRQRQDEVDPAGLDVRGRGECPDPAARHPAVSWAQLAGAPSPAPARSRTTIVSLSWGQAADGYLTRHLTARARRRTPPRCAPASQKPFDRPSITIRVPAARSLASRPLPTCLHTGKRATGRLGCAAAGWRRGGSSQPGTRGADGWSYGRLGCAAAGWRRGGSSRLREQV